MQVQYVKVEEGDVEVVQLAKQMGETPKRVAALINQDRYRKAYNKAKLQEAKVMRQWFKQHPEAMPKEGGK